MGLTERKISVTIDRYDSRVLGGRKRWQKEAVFRAVCREI